MRYFLYRIPPNASRQEAHVWTSITAVAQFQHLVKVVLATIIVKIPFPPSNYSVICGVRLWDHVNILVPYNLFPVILAPIDGPCLSHC